LIIVKNITFGDKIISMNIDNRSNKRFNSRQEDFRPYFVANIKKGDGLPILNFGRVIALRDESDHSLCEKRVPLSPVLIVVVFCFFLQKNPPIHSEGEG